MQSNATADEGFESLGSADKTRYERKLAKLADEDTVTQPNGLWLLLNSVSCWSTHPELRRVRKYGSGRHRFYITGRHTDCTYLVFFVLDFKRAEDDKPQDRRFQGRILRALQSPPTRVLDVPPVPEEDEDA